MGVGVSDAMQQIMRSQDYNPMVAGTGDIPDEDSEAGTAPGEDKQVYRYVLCVWIRRFPFPQISRRLGGLPHFQTLLYKHRL